MSAGAVQDSHAERDTLITFSVIHPSRAGKWIGETTSSAVDLRSDVFAPATALLRLSTDAPAKRCFFISYDPSSMSEWRVAAFPTANQDAVDGATEEGPQASIQDQLSNEHTRVRSHLKPEETLAKLEEEGEPFDIVYVSKIPVPFPSTSYRPGERSGAKLANLARLASVASWSVLVDRKQTVEPGTEGTRCEVSEWCGDDVSVSDADMQRWREEGREQLSEIMKRSGARPSPSTSETEH